MVATVSLGRSTISSPARVSRKKVLRSGSAGGASDTAPGREGREVREQEVCDHECGSQTTENPGSRGCQQGAGRAARPCWTREGGAPPASLCVAGQAALAPASPLCGAGAPHPASHALLELSMGSSLDLLIHTDRLQVLAPDHQGKVSHKFSSFLEHIKVTLALYCSPQSVQ